MRQAPNSSLDQAPERVGIEVADRDEIGAGRADQLAVAGDRVLELHVADPLDALLEGRGVVGMALG